MEMSAVCRAMLVKAMARPFCLPRTESFPILRGGSDEVYRLDIALPDGEPPASGWASICLLDAAGCFGTCVEALRRMARRSDATGVSSLVVIGVSPVVVAGGAANRQRDFTTAPPTGLTDGSPAGGALDFLHFLREEIMSAVSVHAPLDRDRQTLFGHSLAGYFALWTLCNHPGAFAGYAAISPSIWWDRSGLFDAAGRLTDLNRRLFMAVGGWEEALPPWQVGMPGSADALARRVSRQMVANARDLSARLGDVLGKERVRFSLMPEEDHASIVSSAMPHALRLASVA